MIFMNTLETGNFEQLLKLLEVDIQLISELLDKDSDIVSYVEKYWYKISKLFNGELVVNGIEFRKEMNYGLVYENWDGETWNREITETDMNIVFWLKEVINEYRDSIEISYDEDTLASVEIILDDDGSEGY